MKYIYLILLAIMLVISILLFGFCDEFRFQLVAFIFAEIAIYGTLIIYEIKKSKAESNCEKTRQETNNRETPQIEKTKAEQANNKDVEEEKIL